MIGGVPIMTVAVPITPSGRGAIGGISLVIGRPPIGLSAYLCRFRLLREDDRRDRPVRGLSSLFPMAPPLPYRRKDRTGIALCAVEDRHRGHRYHHFLGVPSRRRSLHARARSVALCSARKGGGYGQILVIAVTAVLEARNPTGGR